MKTNIILGFLLSLMFQTAISKTPNYRPKEYTCYGCLGVHNVYSDGDKLPGRNDYIQVSGKADEKLRVVVLTDISNEPDDQQSLVRFLSYANEFDVEGIIAVTSCWKQSNPDVNTILGVIDAYAKVYTNLKLHSPDYPTADYLKSITKSGVNGYGMSAAAGQLSNEGINHIISIIDKPDTRPVWFISWGGSNTLGGAVMKIKNTRTAIQAENFISKIRGYEIALQDDGQAYIMKNFPNAKLISARLQWKGMSKTTPGFNAWPESWGGNNDVLNASWVSINIQNNHGALGQKYPNAVYLYEGDSPSLLYLIPNGLGYPENQNYGSWGGRFGTDRTLNVRSGTGNGTVDGKLDAYKDYYLYTDASDTWTYNGNTYTNNQYAPVFRWREAYQNDFAARMDWCVQPYNQANHPPVATFAGNLNQVVSSGQVINLSADGSSDPDGNTLSYDWMYYKEPGTYTGNVIINNPTGKNASFTVPPVNSPAEIHIILSVTDNGSPALTRYKRIIFTINNLTAVKKNEVANNFSIHPNPANSRSEISFTTVKTERIMIKVYDLVGKEIYTIVNENLLAGQYKYTFSPASRGIYLVKFISGEEQISRKIIFNE